MEMSEVEYVATVIHGLTCQHNHTDGCSWYYERWSAPGYAKEKALKQAENVISTGIDISKFRVALEMITTSRIDWEAEKRHSF